MEPFYICRKHEKYHSTANWKKNDFFCENASVSTSDVLGQKSILLRNVKRKMGKMRKEGVQKNQGKGKMLMLHYYTQLIYKP